jgi:hypothetical protein
MDGSKYRPKGYGMASSAAKRLPYLLLLLVFLTAAGLSVVVMHKVREQRVFAVLIQERDGKVISLRSLLQVWPWFMSSSSFFLSVFRPWRQGDARTMVLLQIRIKLHLLIMY